MSPVRTILLALALAAPAGAQDEGPPPIEGGDDPRIGPSAQGDAQEEIRKLFADVERELRRIDRFLLDASAGDVPVELPDDSGLGDLLRDTQSRSREVVQSIDSILELARQASQRSASGGSAAQPPPSGRPEEQAPPEPRPGEQTPELPEDPSDSKEPPDPEEEDRGQPPPDPAELEPNRPPEPSRGGEAQKVIDAGERWGELPPRVRDIFRVEGGGDMPARYRDWIDAYYRRLNRRDR